MAPPKPSREWELDHPNGKAMLSWNAADYAAWGMEAPEDVRAGKTEGEMMDDEEVARWLKDSIATIRIMFETHPERAQELHAGFALDIDYLTSIDKLTDDAADFALDERNFKWYDAGHGNQAE